MSSASILFLLFIVASFGVPLGLGLAIGRGQRRQLALAVAAVVFWSAWAVYALTASCTGGLQCAAAGIFFATFGLISLAGVGAATLVRGDGGRPGRRTVAVVGVVLLLGAAGAGYSRYGYEIIRWGCPTSAELERPWTVDEVVGAFEESGLPLEPTTVQPPFPRPSGARAYRGAQAFRHEAAGATLHVVACREQCSLNLARAGPGERRRLYRLAGEARPNVVAVITEVGDRRAAAGLRRAIDEPLGDLDRHDYSSRCGGR